LEEFDMDWLRVKMIWVL